MLDLSSIVGVIFPLLTLLAGGGCILLYGSTTTLRANNGDLEKRVELLEAEGLRKDAVNAAQQIQITSQKGELDALSKVITGEVHLVAITDLLTEHHAQAVAEWKVINSAMEAMTALLGDRPRPRES